jgi:hypothetical protein
MESARLPTLFLSHGSPMLAVEDSPAGRFLDGLGNAIPRPRAVVVASAHFMTDRPMLGGHPQPHTVHDFGGFPEPLYAIRYPAPGDPALAEDIAKRIADVDVAVVLHESATTSLAGVELEGAREVLMVVGAEGGITDEELEAMTSVGGHAVRLGASVLRSSTAGVAGLSAICARTRWS